MHVEPPGHSPQSFKEFATHYLMIVVGILTAVAIEQGIEALHHRELAEQATRQIEEELRSNLHEDDVALEDNRKRIAALKQTEEAVTADYEKKDVSPETFRARVTTLTLGTAMPTLRRDAWDAAIASQALSYVDAAVVRRFSEGYSAQHDASQSMVSTTTSNNWMSQIMASSVDSRLGHVDQPALLKALATFEVTLQATAENERELHEALKAAIEPERKPAATGG